MSAPHKVFPAEVKTFDDDEGLVEAIVSVFGNVDYAGDRVMPGAFSNTLKAWREAGDPIPVVVSHDWANPMSHIGFADPHDIEETDTGLKARYRVDIHDNPVAKQSHRLMKRRTLKEHSFAYRVVKEKVGEDGANELHELDLIEIGPTLKGMNPSTELLAVKSLIEQQAQGEDEPESVLSEQDQQKLRSAFEDALQSVLTRREVEEKSDEADTKPEGEGGPVSDPNLSIFRAINQMQRREQDGDADGS